MTAAVMVLEFEAIRKWVFASGGQRAQLRRADHRGEGALWRANLDERTGTSIFLVAASTTV